MNCTKLFVSRRTVLPEGVKPAVLVVSNGIIENIITLNNDSEINSAIERYAGAECEDFGNLVLMPGIVDSHVHINEPGRTQWEGFWTATRAAAAGGVTTLIDMPLNSTPPTTTVQNLKLKVAAAQNKTFVDVGFWGGVVPGNRHELKPLVEAGVVGFKCFLIPSGIPDFGYVQKEDVEQALAELQHLNTTLAFHAECEEEKVEISPQDDLASYGVYLKTCPEIMEVKAIANVKNWCESYKCRCHIVHLSSAMALSLIREAKQKQLPLTAETCFHYLSISAEEIPPGATQFKCCPPIRNEANREELWAALKDHTLDMVVSDHSPCTEDLKTKGNYLTAWGGISSLQFGLALLWTEARKRDFGLQDIVRVLCSGPAKLSGFDSRKGSLQIGMDADFVMWNPDETIEVFEHTTLAHDFSCY
ncbi:allantoinase, mitochondrial [Phymastichus coffea]|uniref:allantoinase, mitochondrial n=1 Tax=Phymastichus coffea TaxID=108790 RepID=UPI00273C944B|nr:allantoinase, mitochondrial [Phymastichus coffea]